MSEGEFHAKQLGSRTIVTIEGPRIDISSVSILRRNLLEYMQGLPPEAMEIAVDLGELINLDSSGIALMVHLKKQVSEQNRKFYLLRANDAIRKMLQLSNLSNLFEYLETDDGQPA